MYAYVKNTNWNDILIERKQKNNRNEAKLSLKASGNKGTNQSQVRIKQFQ